MPSDCLSFSPVTLADKPLVDRYMMRYGEGSCQHSFTALFTLSEKYGSMICERDGFLFTLRQGLCTRGKRVYLAPMGEGDRKGAYAAILADAASYGCRAVFNTLTGEQVAFLQRAFPLRFRYTEHRDYAEYISLSDDLIHMPGGSFRNKRNMYRKLLRDYGDALECRLITPDMTPDILRFEEQWLADNVADHDSSALELEKRALEKQLKYFEALGLSGVCIYLCGAVVAFTYGVALNDRCYDEIVGKASRRIPNLYTLLYRKSVELCAAPYPFFNWEEDVGVEGLRNMKMIYHPAVLMRKYLAEESDEPCPEPETIPIISAIPFDEREALLPGSLAEYENTLKAEG